MKTFLFWLATPLLLVTVILASPVPAGEADDVAIKVWQAFRKLRPHPIQTLAVTEPAADGSRVLIISEPPPHVTLASLKEQFKPLAGAKVLEHAIGYHGWVKDVVAPLNNEEAKQLDGLISALSQQLFRTTYKAHAVHLPVKAIKLPAAALDVKVSATDLERWLTNGEKFVPADGGAPKTLDYVVSQTRPGVFATATSSMVVWWMPRTAKFSDSAVQARQFAIDSDLFLGGFSNAHGLMLIGRLRVVPVDVLPPMRAETVALLAAVRSDQLAQSFERMSVLAGPLDSKLDWAPIYLSSELVDSEYGMLLIIADMIIKAWSNAGDTRYIGFLSESPQNWPFAGPLPKALKLNEVIYNWNTAGAGYTIPVNGFKAFAMARTGSLPVSYIAGAVATKQLVDAEDTAYEYFATLADVQLAQVTRYAGLYQLARAYWNGPEPRPAENMFPVQLQARGMEKLLKRVRDADEKSLMQALQKQIADRKKRRAEITDQLQAIIGESELQFLKILFQSRQDDFKTFDDAELKQMARLSIDRRYGNLLGAISPLLKAFAATDNFPEKYAREVKERALGWIHTAPVVVSFNVEKMAAFEGGHNIDAKVPKFEPSDTVMPRDIKIERDALGRIVIKYHPNDAEKVATAARQIGRWDRSPVNSKKVEAEVRRHIMEPLTPPREPSDALKIPPPPPGGPPGTGHGDPFPHDPRGQNFPGSVGVEFRPPPVLLERFTRKQNEPIVVSRDGANFRVYDLSTRQERLCYTLESAVGAAHEFAQAGDSRSVRLICVDFATGQAEGFAASVRLRALLGNRNQPLAVLASDATNMTIGEVEAALNLFNFRERSKPTRVKQPKELGNKLGIGFSFTIPAMAKGMKLAFVSHALRRKAFPENAEPKVKQAMVRAMDMTFAKEAEARRLEERLRQYHDLLFAELDREGLPIDGVLHELHMEGLNISISRVEKSHDGQQP